MEVCDPCPDPEGCIAQGRCEAIPSTTVQDWVDHLSPAPTGIINCDCPCHKPMGVPGDCPHCRVLG